MVRKSERNKVQGTPEKLIPERTRKSTRQSSRRKKKSSSESEAEPDVVVDKNIKEVGELSESKPLIEPEGPEVKQDGARSRRSVRRQPAAVQSDKEQNHEPSSEWKEDPSFWHPEGPAPPQETSGESKVPPDGGITWKIQSSNGGGGEIQKLKICRQRVTESNDSSSPTKENSPRRKKSTRLTRNLDISTESTDSGGDIPNDKREIIVLPQDTVIPRIENNEDIITKEESEVEISENVVVSKDSGVESNEEAVVNKDTGVENDKEAIMNKDSVVDNDEDVVVNKSSVEENDENLVANKDAGVESDKEAGVDNNSGLEKNEDELLIKDSGEKNEDELLIKDSGEKNEDELLIKDSGEKNEDELLIKDSREKNDEDEQVNKESGVENNEEVEKESGVELLMKADMPDSDLNNEKTSSNVEDTLVNSSICNDSEISEEKDTQLSEIAMRYSSLKSQEETNIKDLQSDQDLSKEKEQNDLQKISSRSDEEQQSSTAEDTIETESLQDITKPDLEMDDEEAKNSPNEINVSNNEKCAVEASKSLSLEGKIKRSHSVSENSEEEKNKDKIVNNSVPEEEVLGTSNERTAKVSKENEDVNQKEEPAYLEPKSPREEGELTPVLETKKPKHTTIIINRPKEVSSEPTKLKRHADDQPTERKKRMISKTKYKEEDPLYISSKSLTLLIPELETITPEEVALFSLDEEGLSQFEVERPSETPGPIPMPPSKKKINLKTKDVEVKVQNDTRTVSKKRQIVFEATSDDEELKTVGPKLPLQENQRVYRKISLLNEDVKKPRRSQSPSGKDATEVLFITNLVRPFTVPQLRELLARTGTIASNGFYIDKIKSKCYVKYTDVEMAVETRHALNGVRWPVNNPKTLKVEFAAADDMTLVQKLAEEEVITKKPEAAEPATDPGWLSEQAALKPQRRVTTAVREWDMGKVGTGAGAAAMEEKRHVEEWQAKPEPQEIKRRATSPEEPKFEHPARKIKKRDNDAPARLLDDLFRKTKTTPCIYWLPLTAAQIAVKEEMRRQHMAEHERRLAELRKTDHSRRDKDREKPRDTRRKK